MWVVLFFFKQKTAYELRISDWSSDVCSSDLWLTAQPVDAAVEVQAAALIHDDLAFTFKSWRAPSFDIWEEEQGQHYYTLRVSAAALEAGADWFVARDEHEIAQRYRSEATRIHQALDHFWLEIGRAHV